MDFRQLDYVITIAREKTLLAAAEKLFLSPSALSQHITKLEQEMQTPLFKRTKQGWIPTRAGQVYIDMAHEVLRSQRKAYLQIADIAENKSGHFTVGVTPGRGTQMFSAVFPAFRSAYPHMEIELFEGTVQENNEMISAGKVDIGFLTSGFPHPGITTRTQLVEDILLVVPKTNPRAAAPAPSDGDFPVVSLKDFADEDFLLAGEGTTLRALENQLFAEAGFAPHVVFETPSLLTLNMLSKGGYGLSFVPRFYADDASNAVYFRTEPGVSWELVAAYRKDHYITKAEQYMIELATDYYRSQAHEYNPNV